MEQRAHLGVVKRAEYPEPIRLLIAELKRMPGIGPRSAERIALWMMQSRNARSLDIAAAIDVASKRVQSCTQCGFFAEDGLCAFCADSGRDTTVLCVVEQATDILPLERTGVFRGLYHALGGRISPLDHIGPEHLRIPQLLERIKTGAPSEIILALGSDVEGEATSSYLVSLLKELSVSITRIAQGLPVGGDLEHADELTLSRALSGRTRLGG